MKKIIPILLALILLVGLMPISAFAADEKSETFICDGKTLKVEGENFNLSAEYIEKGGWDGGTSRYPLTITARDDGIRITHIDAHVCYYGILYDEVGVNRGRKVPESLGFATTGDVSVLDINYRDFSFSKGGITVPFDKITVYFETCEEDGHFYGSDNVCVSCGKTRCEIEGHSLENGFCKFCGEPCHHESEPTKTVVSAEKVCCSDCGETLSFSEITAPENTGSTLSDGNMTIIFTIAALAIGLCGGFVLGKKKKPTPANAVGNDEE